MRQFVNRLGGFWYEIAKALGLAKHLAFLRATALCAVTVIGPPLFEIWKEHWWLWTCWGFLLLVLAFSHLACEAKRAAELEGARKLVRENVGMLAMLAGLMKERRGGDLRPQAFRDRVRTVQTQLLCHLLTTIESDTGLSRNDLHSCWMEYDVNRRTLKTAVRDRDPEDRPRVRELSIDDQDVGASYAIKERRIYIESNARSPEKKELYGETPPYGSFISVPIFVRDEPAGVLNVDAEPDSVFRDEMEWAIKEIGYILAIGELLRLEGVAA